ncbi:MAG: nucleoside monophosphate kinase [Patescibacteria group bacterium]
MAIPRVIIFIGPPGSGKGTQAEILAREISTLTQFDTGQALEAVLMDPRNQDDPVIRHERELFESGQICTSSWTMEVMRKSIHRIAESGSGIILSGSPRKREEADELIPFLQEVYGSDALIVFHVVLPKEVSVFRNSHRRVCKRCSSSLLWSAENEQLTFCPKCGGELKVRVLDKSDVIERRYHEYERLTESLLPFFVSMGVRIFNINGNQALEAVQTDISKALKESIE